MAHEQLHEALSGCASGALPPNVALMRMAILADSKAEIDAALTAARDSTHADARARLDRALALWLATPDAFGYVKRAIAGVVHNAGATIGDWQAAFDRVAAFSPAAGMALYALGREDLLDLATAEIVDRLRDWRLLHAGATVLDIGCGGGRMLRALAPAVRAAAGIEISPGMLAAARRRCAGIDNVSFHLGSGADLAPFGERHFDLVLAVDVFPYLCLTGADLAAKLAGESARVLAPGGAILIFNFSYSGSIEADRREVTRIAAAAGLELCRNGTRDLELWDGATFHLRKPK